MTSNKKDSEFADAKWHFEKNMRQAELELNRQRLELQERELEIKSAQKVESLWKSPLVIAIFAAAAAAIGNALVTVIEGQQSRQTAAQEAEHDRILEMIRTGNPDTAASNLSFLLDTGLINSPELAENLSLFLLQRVPGTGPVLAPATPLMESRFETEFYTPAELEETRKTMARNVTAMVIEDYIPLLPAEIRARVAKLELIYEDLGVHPLFFAARQSDISLRIPLTSLRFLDDLAIVMAWFEYNKCDLGYVDLYLTKALGRAEKVPPPLRAFSVDRTRALNVLYVDDVSQKILKTGVFYFLGKEVAHIALDHELDPRVGWSSEQELAAQDVVLKIFEELGTVPAGAVIYFKALAALDDRFLTNAGTSRQSLHLLTAQIAERISGRPDLYSSSEPVKSAAKLMALELARDFAAVSTYLEQDPATVRRSLLEKYASPPLQTVCPG